MNTQNKDFNFEEKSENITNKIDNQEDIFSELQDLDFGQNNINENIEKPKLNILDIVSKILGFLFGILIIITGLLFFDSYIRTSEDNNIINTFEPLCNFVLYGANNYENKACKSVPNIVKDLEKERDNLKKQISLNLSKLIPSKMQIYNVVGSEEVKFIQEKTGLKISIIDAVNKFNEIKNTVTQYKGNDIECKDLNVNELGEMKISCEILGGSLSNSSSNNLNSSRITALMFLKKIRESNNFTLVDIPYSFAINKYNNTDGGIKAAFSTVTSLNLNLKFITSNNTSDK